MSQMKSNILQPSVAFGANGVNRPAPSKCTGGGGAALKRRLLPVRDTCGGGGGLGGAGVEPPASVVRRNARERNRVKQVNTGFAVLRQHIPVLCGSVIVYGGSQSADGSASSPAAKKNKMSKVETLRCAVEYIRNLEELLRCGRVGGGDPEAERAQSPEALRNASTPGCIHGQPEEMENISPGGIGSNELSSFYDSSTSASASPEAIQQLLFPHGDLLASPPAESFRHRDHVPHLLLDQDPEATDPHDAPDQFIQPSIQALSDHSLLESINSWWGPN